MPARPTLTSEMGHLERFILRTFAEETERITGGAVTWQDSPPEIRPEEGSCAGFLLIRRPGMPEHLGPPWPEARPHAEVMPTREELRQRFGKVDDPEIEARRKRIIEVLLEASPQTKQRLFAEGQLIESRVALRRMLELRQLARSEHDDARIEACTDLATLERWHARAVTAASVSDALD